MSVQEPRLDFMSRSFETAALGGALDVCTTLPDPVMSERTIRATSWLVDLTGRLKMLAIPAAAY